MSEAPGRRLPPKVLYSNIFLVMLGFGALAPALPKVRTTFDLSYGSVSWTITAFSLARLFTNLPAARLVTTLGTRRALAGGTATVLAGNAFCAASADFPMFLGGRVLAGLGSGLAINVGLALTLGGASDAERGRASARYHSALAGGIFFGPAMGGVLAEFGGWRASSLASAFAAAVSLLIISRSAEEPVEVATMSGRTLLSARVAPRLALLGFVATFAIFFVRGASQLTLVPLMGADALGLSTGAIGLLLILPSLGEIFLGQSVGGLSDRIGRHLVIVPAVAALSIGVVVLSHATSVLVFAIGMVISASSSAANACAPALIVDAAPPDRRGRAVSTYRLGADIAFALGPLVAGWLVTHRSFAFAGSVIGGSTFGALLLSAAFAWPRESTATGERNPTVPLPTIGRHDTSLPSTFQGGVMTTRVWDQYLTERDKQQLEVVGPRARVGWGEKPAVLLVDNYRGVLGQGPEPLLEQVRHLPMGTGEEGWAAVRNIANVLAVARAAGIPIVHITGLAADGLAGFVDAYRPGPRKDVATQLAGFEFPPEVAPEPGEVVLAKSAPSAFFGTPLVGHLQHLGVDTLVVCGETTSGCVRASVVDACSYRYRVILPEECNYDRHEACHAINLFDMDQKYADVVPVAEVLAHLSGLAASEPEPALSA